MHWSITIENACLSFFSDHEFLSRHVLHSLSCCTLISPSITIGRMCWILYSDSTISLFRTAKEILALAAMVGSPSMTWSSNTPFWNCCALSQCCYDWYLLLMENLCSSNKSLVCSGLVIIPVLLLINSLLILSLCIFLTWWTRFSHVVLIWSADSFWP